MKTTTRVPLAPGQPMPALDEFLRPFHVHFARSEATHALERYLTGMLTEHPNKNCDTLAQVVPGTTEQSLQGLMPPCLPLPSLARLWVIELPVTVIVEPKSLNTPPPSPSPPFPPPLPPGPPSASLKATML